MCALKALRLFYLYVWYVLVWWYRVAREEMFVVGQRPDIADILIVITDGMFDDPNATWIEAMETRAQGISIIAVSTSTILFSLLWQTFRISPPLHVLS